MLMSLGSVILWLGVPAYMSEPMRGIQDYGGSAWHTISPGCEPGSGGCRGVHHAVVTTQWVGAGLGFKAAATHTHMRHTTIPTSI